jgi:uncharacterized protein (DUF1501 family)
MKNFRTTAGSNVSRRLFLQQSSALSMLGSAAAPLALNLAAMGSAAAQSAGDYKALVCIFLYGGNDAHNTVLATDAPSWSAYTTTRNQAPSSIALLAPGTQANPNASPGSPARLGGVLPLNPSNGQGRSFAVHPQLTRVASMFNSDRRLAIVPNVGPMRAPMSKQQYASNSVPKPVNLFSHNDQQNAWQALGPEGASIGWGGRMADLIASQNTHAMFTAISATGNATWLSGQAVRQYQVGARGAVRMGPRPGEGDAVYSQLQVTQAMERIVSRARGNHLYEHDMAALNKRSIDAERILRGALPSASDAVYATPVGGEYVPAADPKLRFIDPTTGAATFNPLAQQLQVVSRMLLASTSASLGAKRQVFFVSLGGFDTHDNQNASHARLMAQLNQALGYFDTTLSAAGLRDKVTTFTASDFGRTFTSNGDGTDHGWGGHQFVMGGAVRGGNLYGAYPVLGLKNANNNGFDSSPDQIDNGALLPTTSVDQMGATMARWFGLSDAQCLEVFPNLAQFDASRRNLGFMV